MTAQFLVEFVLLLLEGRVAVFPPRSVQKFDYHGIC